VFSNAVSPDSLNTHLKVKDGSTAIAGTISANQNTARFLPTVSLPLNKLITVEVTSGLTDSFGLAFCTDFELHNFANDQQMRRF
jgi:hypothetical protein